MGLNQVRSSEDHPITVCLAEREAQFFVESVRRDASWIRGEVEMCQRARIASGFFDQMIHQFFSDLLSAICIVDDHAFDRARAIQRGVSIHKQCHADDLARAVCVASDAKRAEHHGSTKLARRKLPLG